MREARRASELVTIVIPVYKRFPSANEEKSLMQCLRICSGRSISIVCAAALDVCYYLRLATENTASKITVRRFQDESFASIEGYSRLLLSPEFYEEFADYEYILIHQLDAYLFRDELESWCKRGYDYVGAPWFEGFTEQSTKFFGVGNGGLSLRKTGSAISILRGFKSRLPMRRLFPGPPNHSVTVRQRFTNALCFLKACLQVDNELYGGIRRFAGNEDIFWGHLACRRYRWYRVPPPEVASRFSFEMHPAYLYKMNEERLPMGCHAWERYDPAFWKQFII